MTGVTVGAQESDERLLGERRFPPRGAQRPGYAKTAVNPAGTKW
jgi:hypothetical protein